MKLLYVIGSFYPSQLGGPCNTTYWAAKDLASRGAEVTVASLCDGITPDHCAQYGITFNKACCIDNVFVYFFSYKFSRFFSSSMFWWLIKNIKKYDMVSLTSVFFPWTWFSAFLCIIYDVPFVIAPRGELEPGAIKFGALKKKILIWIFIRRIVSHAKFLLVTSEQERKYSAPYFLDNVSFEILPNYSDIDSVSLSDEEIIRKRDILYLGRLHPKKGIESLIAAFNLLPNEITDNNKLVIVGSGESHYVNSLKNSVKSLEKSSDIIFLGHLEALEKREIYERSRLLVLPSYSENFGNVVIEALSHSTPVVASRYTPWSQLEENGCGLWVDNDPSSLANAINSIFDLDQLSYALMASAAREFYFQSYDIHSNGIKIDALYRSYL